MMGYEKVIKFNNYIISSIPGVKRIDRIRAREHGYYVLVDIRISIHHEKTIKEGHDLSREVKQALMTEYDNTEEVLIHLNPYYNNEELKIITKDKTALIK